MKIEFNPEEIIRYSRQLVLPEIGLHGQVKLKESAVLIVGCGGLGSPIALYLAAAGIGRIGIVDYDTLDLSNLARQVIYSSDDIGKEKVLLAQKRLYEINPQIQVDIYKEVFTSLNALRISDPYQIIIDGTDNIPTRYLINDVCVITHKPYVYGAIYQFTGQVGVFDASKGACYRCVYPEPPSPDLVPSCAIAGVPNVVPGIIGLFQAAEVIKLLLTIGAPLISKLLLYDALDFQSNIISIPKNDACKVCGNNPEIYELIDYEKFCMASIQNQTPSMKNGCAISPKDLYERLIKGVRIRLVDLREPVELQIFSIPNSENIPFHKLTEEMKKWDKSQPVVLICNIGVLSDIAQRILSQAGFEDVKNLVSGILGWIKDIDSNLSSN